MVELNIDKISTVVGKAPETPDAIKINPTSLNIDQVSTVAPESSMLNKLSQLAAGFNETFYYYPDMGYKTIAKSFADLGLIENDEVTGLTEFFNQNVKEPETSADKIFRTTGQETAKALPFITAPYLAATSKVYTGIQPIKKTADEVVKVTLNQIRNNPASTFLAEQLATFGFGVGKGLAEETAPDSPTAQAIYPVVGAFTPSVASSVAVKTPTAIAFKLGSKLKNYFSKEAQEQRAVQGLSSQFKSAFNTPDAKTNIQRAEELKSQIGDDYVLSPAEQSGSPQLIASQKQIENDATGSDLDKLVKRKENNIKAVDGFIVKHFPSDGDEAPFVYDTITKKFNDLSNVNQIQTKSALNKLQASSEKFPFAEKSVIGANLRTTIKDLRKEAVDDFNKYAEDLKVDLQEQVDFQPLKDEIASTLNLNNEFKPSSKFADIKSLPNVIYDIKKIKKDGTITYGELKDLRERVSDDLLDALGSATPQRKLIKNLTLVKQNIDNYLDEQSDLFGENYKEFRNAYKQRIIDRFEKSGAYKVKALGSTQEYTIANEKVADVFLSNVDSAKQFKTVFTNPNTNTLDADALQSLENVVFDKVRKQAFKDDFLDSQKLQKFINTNREVLEEFPTILNKLNNEQKVIQQVSNRISQLKKRASLINENILAKKLSFGQSPLLKKGEDIDKIIASAIKEPSLMYNVANRLKTNEEKEALRKAVAKTIFSSTDIVNNPEKLRKILLANEKSLKYVFTPEHKNNLKTIADAFEFALRTPMPQGMGETPQGLLNTVTDVTGQGVPSILSRYYAAESGRTSTRYVTSDMLGRFFITKGKKRAEALFKESMFNPNLAKEMSDIGLQRKYDKEKIQKLNLVLFNLGYPQNEE